MADVPAGLLRPALAGLVPYEPGKPVEEVQRELGLERVVKLASNEGPFPPFPAALEAIDRVSRELNRYPDGGAYRLRGALAEQHGVALEEVVVGAGAYADGIEDHFKDGGRVVVLRTFAKIFGLAGLRVGYGIAPADVVAATSKVRRAFDVTATAQAAALASIGDDAEIARRRAANAAGRAQLETALGEHGLEPAGPALGNFLFADVGDGRGLFDQLLGQGVI